MTERSFAETISRLGEFPTATLFESGESVAALPPPIKPLTPSWKVCGEAFTVETAPGHNIWLHRALYEASPGSVLVVSTQGGFEFGYWGEVMSRAATACRLGGLVIDGFVRDCAELLEVGFPVFARGLFVRGTGKDPDLGGGTGHAIEIESVRVEVGDVVVGDADGVVVVPRQAAETIAAGAETRTHKERDIFRALAAGQSTLELYGWDPA